MKQFLGIILLLTLVSCSEQKEQAPPPIADTSNSIIDVAKISNGGSSIQLNLDLVDFGVTDQGENKKVVKTVVIKNTSDSNVNINIVPLSANSGFSILKNLLCSKTIAAKSECSLSIQFFNQGLYDATYNDGLIVTAGNNSIAVQFTAQVTGNAYAGDNSGVDKLFLTLNSPFNLRGNPYRELTVNNVGTASSLSLIKEMPPGYVVRLNRCPTLLLNSRSCSMQVIYDNYQEVKDPPTGMAMVASGSTSTSINLLTGVSNFINNENIFTNLFWFPSLVNYQSGFSMVHYPQPLAYIKKNNYKLILIGDGE